MTKKMLPSIIMGGIILCPLWDFISDFSSGDDKPETKDQSIIIGPPIDDEYRDVVINSPADEYQDIKAKLPVRW